MKTLNNQDMKEPVGRIMAKMGKLYHTKFLAGLGHLDINRSFYPLLLIDARDGMTQQELAHELSCDKVQVVRIIDYLSKNSYVERILNQTDKRKNELTITDKAGKLIPDIKKAINSTSGIAFKGLSENQIDELYKTLTIIEINLLSK